MTLPYSPVARRTVAALLASVFLAFPADAARPQSGFAPRGAPHQLTNLGLHQASAHPVGELFLLQYPEAGNGGDVNGDGDELDQAFGYVVPEQAAWVELSLTGSIHSISQGLAVLRVEVPGAPDRLYVFDGASGSAIDSGILWQGQTLAYGATVGWRVSESDLGRDASGDGDLDDLIFQLVDLMDGSVLDTGLPVAAGGGGSGRYTEELGYWLVAVEESSYGPQGTDLDGDGDVDDAVTQVVDSTGGVANTQVSYLTISVGSRRWSDQGTVCTLPESWNGDLNGDGDHWDTVFAVVHWASGAVINTTLEVGTPEWSTLCFGNHVAVTVSEAERNADLNGDGDLLDLVAHLVSISSGVATNLAVVGSQIIGRDELFAMTVQEWQQGTDLNGDGDTADGVLSVYDQECSCVATTGLSFWPNQSIFPSSRYAVGGIYEGEQGLDLNGDGDLDDTIEHLITWR